MHFSADMNDPNQNRLPRTLYTAQQVRELDRCAIETHGIPGLTLMERAGEAAFRCICRRWPEAKRITVLCGTGNNGGDGYVVARLAKAAGLTVELLQLGDSAKLQGDALASAEKFRQSGGVVEPFRRIDEACELIVDGILGTGLERNVSGAWAEALQLANQHPAPCFSLDIPSGLHSDSGRVMGCAIQACATITFIGLKRGMLTSAGPDYCGQILFDDLSVPSAVYQQIQGGVERIDWPYYSESLAPRRRTQHKGGCGHLLLVGGDCGYAGAIRMAGEAAARAGAGLVSIATRHEHAALIACQRPELMAHGIEDAGSLLSLLRRADVVAIGPGLGQGRWGQKMLARILQSRHPLVLDADALNLLAREPMRRDDWILTPHPGEASRLLGVSVREVQEDRFATVESLRKRYGGVVLLKGAGTLIATGDEAPVVLSDEGNPGMASGGMGDVLTGVVGSLVAQGESLAKAACIGACLHGEAADRAASAGERGMLASDLMPEIRHLVNSAVGRSEAGEC